MAPTVSILPTSVIGGTGWYKEYASEPQKEKDNWYIEFTEESARR